MNGKIAVPWSLCLLLTAVAGFFFYSLFGEQNTADRLRADIVTYEVQIRDFRADQDSLHSAGDSLALLATGIQLEIDSLLLSRSWWFRQAQYHESILDSLLSSGSAFPGTDSVLAAIIYGTWLDRQAERRP